MHVPLVPPPARCEEGGRSLLAARVRAWAPELGLSPKSGRQVHTASSLLTRPLTRAPQYVYATVAASKEALDGAATEPQFKFNNGHFGGSHDVLDAKHAALAGGNKFAGSCLFAIKPFILKLL